MFESLIHSLDAIVWQTDPESLEPRFISQQAERILEYPVDDWLAEVGFWQRHIHPDDVQACRQLTADSPPLQLEYRLYHADGRCLWLRDHITVSSEHSQPIRLEGVKFELTDRTKPHEQQRE